MFICIIIILSLCNVRSVQAQFFAFNPNSITLTQANFNINNAVDLSINPAAPIGIAAPISISVPNLTQSFFPVANVVNSFSFAPIPASNIRKIDLQTRIAELTLNAESNPDAVRTAVKAIAPEETMAQGESSVEGSHVLSTNIFARIATLRGGSRGTAFNINGKGLPDNALASLLTDGGSFLEASPDESSILSKKLGTFITGSLILGDKDETRRENGFDFNTKGVTGGLDYKFTDNFFLGTAFSYVRTDNKYDESAGSLDIDGYVVSIYGSYYVTDKFYIDGIASFGWNDYDQDRKIAFSVLGITDDGTNFSGSTTVINQTARSDPDGTQYAFSFSSGYNFNKGGFTFGPYGRVNYTDVNIDKYQEEIDNTNTGSGLAIEVDDQDIHSFTSVLGAQANYAVNTRWAVFVPQTWLEWEHEYDNDIRDIDVSFVESPDQPFSLRTDHPDRDFFNTGFGLSAVFPGGRSAFIHYETILGLDDVTSHNIGFGVRFEL